MNAPSPSSRRIPYSRRIAPPARSAQHAPPIVVLAHNMRPASNEDTATEDTATIAPPHAVNPLWMITAALAVFVVTMVLIIVS